MRAFIPMIIAICLFVASLAAAAAEEKAVPVKTADVSILEEKWGVKVLGLRQSANGYMLDFRYRVLDPEKAAPLFDRKVKPLLIDQATGAKFAVPEPPKVGALRNTRKPVANKNYFVIFANPAQYVKKGNKVTVVIGDFRVENLVVE
ncbi:MAG: hypothetical protein ACOYW7_13460 [Nitrospirota bacterium]